MNKPEFFSEQVMEDAIKEYGCCCDQCCAALMVNRALDKKVIAEEKNYLSQTYLGDYTE